MMGIKNKVSLQVVVNQEYQETYIYIGFPVQGKSDPRYPTICILNKKDYLEREEELVGYVSLVLEGELLKRVRKGLIISYVNRYSGTWEDFKSVADFETISPTKEESSTRFKGGDWKEIVLLSEYIDPEELEFLDLKLSEDTGLGSLAGFGMVSMGMTANLIWRDYGRTK